MSSFRRIKRMVFRLVMSAAIGGLLFLPPSVSTVQAFTNRVLVNGSQGYGVDELQNRLKLLGYYWGKVDGKFGWDTYWAVRTFQFNFGLPVSGRVDMKTRLKLVKATPNWHLAPANSGNSNSQSVGTPSGNSASTSPVGAASGAASATAAVPSTPPAMNGLSQHDINLMAHVVNGEARGEPFKGQVAIAAVILNRLHDPRFPHSIPGIVYQPGAFTAVQDGQVNLPPDKSATKAVIDALKGMDPSMGAVYYFNPATATNKWIWSRPEIIQIGKHIFCH